MGKFRLHKKVAYLHKINSPANDCPSPKSPVSGRVKPADFGVAESRVYSARFRQVFGTALEGTAGSADTDAQFSGDDLPRGAGGSEAGHLVRLTATGGSLVPSAFFVTDLASWAEHRPISEYRHVGHFACRPNVVRSSPRLFTDESLTG